MVESLNHQRDNRPEDQGVQIGKDVSKKVKVRETIKKVTRLKEDDKEWLWDRCEMNHLQASREVYHQSAQLQLGDQEKQENWSEWRKNEESATWGKEKELNSKINR